jgi:hypothetical protein
VINSRTTSNLPGTGVFSYHEDLVLTAHEHGEPVGLMSHWDISPWAGNEQNRKLHLLNRPENLSDLGHLRSADTRWQEMVIDETHYPGIGNWAERLIKSSWYKV